MVYALHQDGTAQYAGSILIRAPFPVLLFLKDHRVTLLNDGSFSTVVIINWNRIFQCIFGREGEYVWYLKSWH